MKFGAHMSASGGVFRALERGESIGCEAVQLFVKNNMQWFGRPHPPADVARFKAERKRVGFAAVFGHTGYLINLGGPASNNRDRSLQSLIQEITFADALGIPFLVLHPGAHLGAGEDVGVRQTVAGLNEVITATKHASVRIALENTAGQGSCLGHDLTHLADIYAAVSTPQRLGICIDTCHLFAAGHDIRTGAGWDKAMRQIEKLIGLKEILAFHLNDSKVDLASRVDRHEHIGQGKIGLDGFRHLVNDPRFVDTPACLETYKSEDLHEDVANLKTLRSLVFKKVRPVARAKTRQAPAKRTKAKSGF
jgi:deoxyribonuclease-4